MRQVEAIPKRRQPIQSREDLIEHLRWAMTLELSTIPPYLTAMYSLQDATTDAYALMKSVALEEMLHLGLVCNLLSAIGGCPEFNADTVPEYPTYIPHHAAGGPFISLQALSTAVAQSTFCGIETPSDLQHPPPEGDHFQTIGQFYQAIWEGFQTVHAKLGADLFVPHSRQLNDGDYFGGGGGRLFRVQGMPTAHLAIREIVAQGEGARPGRAGREGEPFGGRLHYGTRPDGTYGPILGVGVELSHYERFTQLANGTVAIGATWPMQTNLKSSEIADPSLRALADLQNQTWALILAFLQQSYAADTNLFFTGAVPLMHTVLPSLARLLLATPLDPRTGSLGPNAGPTFEWTGTTLTPAELASQTSQLAEHAPAGSDASTQQSWTSTLDALVPFLQNLPALPEAS